MTFPEALETRAWSRRENKEGGGGRFIRKNLAVGLKGADRENALR